MARPALFDYPMTAAERMRLYRWRKKNGESRPVTNRDKARAYGISLRTIYYTKVCWSLLTSDKEFFVNWWDGKYGTKYRRVTVQFLAEVARHGSVKEQRAVLKRIKQSGAAAGRALWQKLLRNGKHEELLRRKQQQQHQRRINRSLGRRGRLNPHLGMTPW